MVPAAALDRSQSKLRRPLIVTSTRLPARNREYCLSLGADHFYDYEKDDFTKSSERWDVVFDVAGKSHYLSARAVLKEGGHFVSTEPNAEGVLVTILTLGNRTKNLPAQRAACTCR